ncbi:MAG: PepSY domain-containing protein [Halothiobacillaceae bacterium]
MNRQVALAGVRLALVAAVAASTQVYAHGAGHHDEDGYEHKQILELHARGQIMSMEEIIARALQIQSGQLIEAALDRDDGRYVYELKIIAPKGQLYELELDASDATLIEHELAD